ncbi:hypothetical protein GC194_03315 [bacterium]|nr:hypothetical protein [bacterium]
MASIRIIKYHILILCMLTIPFRSVAKNDGSGKSGVNFTKMLLDTTNIYALNTEGQLIVWNLKELTKIYKSDTIKKFTAIAQNRSGDIFLGTSMGKIFKINKEDFSLQPYLELKVSYSIYDMFFNSDNKIFVIIHYAVYDPIKDKYWGSFKHEPNGIITSRQFLHFFKKRTYRYFDMPNYSFIDGRDRIWMIKSFGEFGGSVQIFDTRKRKALRSDFDGLDFRLLYPKSVFEDSSHHIFITSGVMHFMCTGDIFRIDNQQATNIYHSEDFIDSAKHDPWYPGILVGPGAYNAVDNNIYFATSEGFFRASLSNNGEGNVEHVEFLFNPNLLWDSEPLAIGLSMSIKKLTFTIDNRLVFLTSQNGIGIYDGVDLKMID